MEERLDADAVARVLRRAHELAEQKGTIDPAIDGGGVSPEALVAAADEVGIDPATVREALAMERFERSAAPGRRLDRLVGVSEVAVQRTIGRDIDDVLDDIEQWLIVGHQMRCLRPNATTIESRPRTGIGASLSRAATEFTDDENIHPVDRIDVEAYQGDGSDDPVTMVRITAVRRTTRSWRLGGGGAAGVAGAGVAVAGALQPFVWGPVVGAGLVGGGLLLARSGGTHAERVEIEMQRVLSAVARAERPTGIAGRAARQVRSVVKSVRSNATSRGDPRRR